VTQTPAGVVGVAVRTSPINVAGSFLSTRIMHRLTVELGTLLGGTSAALR
jgi:hypothetical protein